MRIDLADGKYTYIFDGGKQQALRYGEPWRDLTGENLIYYMACEIENHKAEVERLNNHIKFLDDAYERAYKEGGSSRNADYDLEIERLEDVIDDLRSDVREAYSEGYASGVNDGFEAGSCGRDGRYD